MECHTSKVKVLGLLGLTCLMVGVSYFCTTLPDAMARVVGWIGTVFFGLGFIAFPIHDRRLKIGVIPWEDVRSLSIGSVHSTKFLCIEVVDREKYLSRFSRWKRHLASASEGLGFPALTINFAGLRPGLKDVWAYLEARRHTRLAQRRSE